jgi:hypothetical protein
LLGPTTALGAPEGSLLSKTNAPNAIEANIERHHQFAKRLAFGGKGLLRSNDPADQENAIVWDWRTFVPKSHAFSSAAQHRHSQSNGFPRSQDLDILSALEIKAYSRKSLFLMT